MLTLEAGTILVAKAQTDATITMTVYGMQLVGTTETYEKLYQGQPAAAGGTIYTVPGATQTFVKSIHAVNTAGSTQTFTLFAGGSAAANRLTPDITLPANGWATYGEDGWRIYDVNGVLQVSTGAGGGTQTAISGIGNSQTTYTSGTVSLSAMGNLTIDSAGGQAFRFSVANQTVQTQVITNDQISVGVSTGGNTQGNTTVNTGSRFVLVGTNGITLSQATGAGSTTISISGNAAQTNQSAIKAFGASNTGNTAGNTGVSTGVDWVIAGTSNVTVSESTAGGGPNTIWISAAGGGGAGFSGGVSTGGNTQGNTGVTGTRLVFVGTNNITLSQNTDANGGTISISGVASQTGSFLSIGVSTGGSTAGNTTVNSGNQFVLVGSDGMSLSQGTAANATTVSIRNIYSTGTTVSSVSNANAVGANNSRFALEAHIHEGARRIGISTAGNTAGTTGIFPVSNMMLVGSNGITLSQSTDAASNISLTISGPGAGGGGYSAGVSTFGNTAGSTGVTGTRLVLVGTNNITLSQSTDANGGTISISGAGGGAGQFSGGVSNLGDTAGSTGITGTQGVFVGSQGITLSQSTGANGGTISILGPPPASYFWNVYPNTSATSLGQTSSVMVPFMLPSDVSFAFLRLPGASMGAIASTTFATSATSFTASWNTSYNLQVFSRGTGASSLSLQQMFSTQHTMAYRLSFTASAAGSESQYTYTQAISYPMSSTAQAVFTTSTNQSSGTMNLGSASLTAFTGQKVIDFPWATSLARGQYWLAFGTSTASATQWTNASGISMPPISIPVMTQFDARSLGEVGVGSNVSVVLEAGLGMFTAVAGATTASVPFANISMTAGGLSRSAPVLAFALHRTA